MAGLLDADTQRPGPSRPGVRLVDSLDGLAVVAEPDVVAAIWVPPALPRWHAELVTALRDHRFTIPRTVLTDVVPGAVDAWLRRQAGAEALTASTLDHLCAEVEELVEVAAALSGSRRLLVRVLTATPNAHCGFHVDTTRAGVAPWGVLKTYHGVGTAYVDPASVSSTRDFYRYVSRRERLVRELDEASDDSAAARLRLEIARLDDNPGFHSGDVGVAPAWSVVAFKHLDASLMWGDHRADLAWIHCSPMEGEPRLVVNVTGRDRLARRTPPASGASPR